MAVPSSYRRSMHLKIFQIIQISSTNHITYMFKFSLLVATITAEDYRFISSGNRQDQQPRQRKGQGLAGAAVVSAAGILTDSLPIDLLPEQIQQSRSDGPQKADRHRQGGGSRLTTMTSSFQAPRLLRTCQYQHFLRRLNPAPAPNPAIFLHRGARERRSREWSRVQTRPWVRTGQAAQRLRRRIRQQGGGGEAGGGRSIQRGWVLLVGGRPTSMTVT